MLKRKLLYCIPKTMKGQAELYICNIRSLRRHIEHYYLTVIFTLITSSHLRSIVSLKDAKVKILFLFSSLQDYVLTNYQVLPYL